MGERVVVLLVASVEQAPVLPLALEELIRAAPVELVLVELASAELIRAAPVELVLAELIRAAPVELARSASRLLPLPAISVLIADRCEISAVAAVQVARNSHTTAATTTKLSWECREQIQAFR